MSEKPLRIGFMGTPDFAKTALEKLVTSGHSIVCAYSQPPRPKGRGHKLQKSPVHEYAEGQNIPVYTPQNFKGEEARTQFAAHNLDVAVVAAYGLILPQEILDMPRYGCLNIHASLLPRWRGAAPIQYAIWKGDDKTGVTIMQMERGLDTGPMIAKKEIAITPQTTASNLHDDLAEIGGEMIVEVLEDLQQFGFLQSEKQDDNQSSYAAMLKKEDGIIDWHKSAIEIDRQIRALNPWPGVWTIFGDQRIKILEAKPAHENSDIAPGTVLDKKGHVACAQGVLQLITLQPEGKKPMDVASAINGGYLKTAQ
ncbi:MAG: methionyl-tRNA formyltransferase [Alphaproteobacteria bacterium]